MRPGHRSSALLAVAIVGASWLGACSDGDDPTPEELRRERLETRLSATFPAAQASCIVDGLDDATLVALDRDGDLPADSEAMRIYSFVVRACVSDPNAAKTTTTAAGATTTTAAPTTTTAPGGT